MKHAGRSIRIFLAVVLLALFVKMFVFDIIYVSGPSMKPSLQNGAFILELKLAWGIPVPFRNAYMLRWGKPVSGEVVIFPWLGRYVVKRIAATEGTPLAFSAESGYSVLIGNRSVPLNEAQYQKLKNADRVPEGMIFALGDNMAESRDSRDYGFVSYDSIRGKVLWK